MFGYARSELVGLPARGVDPGAFRSSHTLHMIDSEDKLLLCNSAYRRLLHAS